MVILGPHQAPSELTLMFKAIQIALNISVNSGLLKNPEKLNALRVFWTDLRLTRPRVFTALKSGDF